MNWLMNWCLSGLNYPFSNVSSKLQTKKASYSVLPFTLQKILKNWTFGWIHSTWHLAWNSKILTTVIVVSIAEKVFHIGQSNLIFAPFWSNASTKWYWVHRRRRCTLPANIERQIDMKCQYHFVKIDKGTIRMLIWFRHETSLLMIS